MARSPAQPARRTDIASVAEQKALEKVGFQRDGVMCQAQYRDGTWHDTGDVQQTQD